MAKYEYTNDYERECTEKYEGVYTEEEAELNQKLLDECTKDKIDYAAVEELLKKGADPLGAMAEYGWDLLNHVYGEVICELQDDDCEGLVELTELFLKYGMDVDTPRIPYDNDNSLSPLWHYTFVVGEKAAKALELLLDAGMSADSFVDFWDHSITDFFHCECGDPENEEFWNKECTWTFKMMFLGASYDHIWNDESGPRDFLCGEYNTYDVHKFREWNNYEYHYDTSYCDRFPELYGSIVHVYEKETGTEVWTFGVGSQGRETLGKLRSDREA